MQVEEVKQLRHGDVLIFTSDGSRWRVNGQVKTWKTRPDEVKVPLKHGLYRYGYITHNNCQLFQRENQA